MVAKPIVKWAGGKTRLLAEILERVPTTMRTYAEPFAGGAALFFALASEREEGKPGARSFERAVLADRNVELVTCYRAVQGDVDAVIEALRPYRYDEALYYETRDVDPTTLSAAARAARFIFLNRTCYNGLWRVNSRGGFNVPFGRYTNPRILDEEGLRVASRALADVEIELADFQAVTDRLGPGDFVYFDPPYAPVSKTSDFTAYAAGGFGPEEQRRLAGELTRLRARGVLALLSNADTPDTRLLYQDFAVDSVMAARAINSKGERRGQVSELLVSNWLPGR